MTIGLKANVSGTSGTIQIGGADQVTIDNAGGLTATTVTGTTVAGTTVAGTTVTQGGVAMPRMVLSTAQNTTSGTAIDFTGIPSWVKKITVIFNGVSTSGTSQMQIQIGAGSVTASGYTGSCTGGGGGVATTSNSTGFLVTYINVAATAYFGIATLATLGSNVWVESGTLGGAATGVFNASGGALTLGGTLDRVRLTTVNGTDTFDAGSVNILYEG